MNRPAIEQVSEQALDKISSSPENIFEVLGKKVRFIPIPDDQVSVSADSVVAHVNEMGKKILEKVAGKTPPTNNELSLESNQLAILVALELAQQKLRLEVEMKEQMNRMRTVAQDALGLLQDVTPSTH